MRLVGEILISVILDSISVIKTVDMSTKKLKACTEKKSNINSFFNVQDTTIYARLTMKSNEIISLIRRNTPTT